MCMGEKFPKIKNSLHFNDLVESNISKRHSDFQKFYEMKDNPNKIIRVEHFDELRIKHDCKLKIPELVEAAKKLFKELDEKYGIHCSVDFAIGKDKEGNDVVFSTTDRIEGDPIGEVHMSEEFLNKLKKSYAGIAKYFLDKFKEGGLYIWDINGESQYVYGKKLGDTENNIYLVDTDVWFSKNKNDMYLSVYWLLRHMSFFEYRAGIQFSEARNYIIEFIKQPLPEHLDKSVQENLNEIRKLLNNEKSDYDSESAIPRFE